MTLINLIRNILNEQGKKFRPIPVDIKISNGNILLRAFHIYDFDPNTNIVKGLTSQEEYAYAREEREPVYCFLKADEIKELICADLDLEFSTELSFAKV
jgi:hypothetical protein